MVVKEGRDFYGIHFLKQKTINVVEFEEFEPLLFIEFTNSINTIQFQGKVNKNHPLIKWYFEWHNLLRKGYFYYSKQLIFILTNYTQDSKKTIEEINIILKRLRNLLPEEAKPSEHLNLSIKDFQINL